MKSNFYKKNSKRILGYLMVFAMVFFSTNVNGQCINTSSYGSAVASASSAVPISTCQYLTEYSTITGIYAGSSYTCDVQYNGNNVGYVTVTELSPTGTVVSHGWGPHTFTANTSGTHYIHWTVDSLCSTATGCHVSTITGNAPLIPGCTDTAATNYNPLANVDDGTCLSHVPGCMDSDAFNYNPSATQDNGLCVARVFGCTNPDALNYNPLANTDDDTCIVKIPGCNMPQAINYDPEANYNDGSCVLPEWHNIHYTFHVTHQAV